MMNTMKSRTFSLDAIRSVKSSDTNTGDNTSYDDTNENDDPIGMHMVNLLNAGAFELSGGSSSSSSSFLNIQSKKKPTLFPLFSKANAHWLQNILQQSCQIIFNTTTIQSTATTTNVNNQSIILPTLSQVVKTTFIFLTLSSIFISTCTHIILSFIAIFYIVTIFFIVSILIDFQDLYDTCPIFIQCKIDYVINYMKDFGVTYLYTERYIGRDQWITDSKNSVSTSNSASNDHSNSNNSSNSSSNNGAYQFLTDRKESFAIMEDRRRCDRQRQSASHCNGHNPISHTNAVWQCQNVHWDELYSTLIKQHKDETDTSDSTLDQSSLDHLIATNYCYVMVNGMSRKAARNGGKQKAKKKIQLIHRKKSVDEQQSENNHNNDRCIDTSYSTGNISRNGNGNGRGNIRTVSTTLIHKTNPLSPILSTRSEDVCELFDQMDGLNSVQSMDAIEVIRPKSKQRHEFMKKIQPSPLIKRFKKKFVKSPDYDLDDDDNHNNNHYTNVGKELKIKNDRGRTKLERKINFNPHSPAGLEPDLTFAPSEDFGHDGMMNSFSDDADVSYSSTSYTHEEKKERSLTDSKDKDDMKWLDVGAKIGMRILESEKLHQAITKSHMAPNVSSSYSGAEEENDESQKESFDLSNFESPKNIARPFHAMWTSPNVGNPSFDDVISEDDETYSEDEPVKIEELLAYPPPPPPPLITRRFSVTSLSPSMKLKKGRSNSKTLRGYGRSISLPTSPIRSRSISSRLSDAANASVSSAEASHLVPKQFDANRYLPPSMAIHHEKVSEAVKPAVQNDKTNKKIDVSSLAINTNLFNHQFSKKFHKESARVKARRRTPLLPGIRMVVPIFPGSRIKKDKIAQSHCYYQFATVTSSKRIKGASSKADEEDIDCDCLSITVLLDKSLLRSAKFAEMTMRIPDIQRHMPRHSKFPVGSCVATSFGIGVLVGWRAEDDCHIIRALWQKRSIGVAHAYLNRNALHEVMEAAVGFKVGTTFGNGKVIAYVEGGKNFTQGKYIVLVKKNEVRSNRVQMELSRSEIKSCHSSNFIPVVEQIKEAAKYQIQVDKYRAFKFEQLLEDESLLLNQTWRVFSEGFELFLSSFIKAAEEDDNIDSEINNYLTSIIAFLEDFDLGGEKKGNLTPVKARRSISESTTLNLSGRGMWIVDDLFGDVTSLSNTSTMKEDDKHFGRESYDKLYAFLNTAARTVAIAQSSCSDRPNFKMALAITHEIIIFIHNVIKVQQVNMSKASVIAWQKTLAEFTNVFGSMNSRVQAIGNGIIQRLEEHGKVAKVRAICFADTLISDDILMKHLEDGDIKKCLERVENAVVSANILDNESCEQYHKIGLTLYSTLAPRDERNQEAAVRSGKKITFLAKVVKVLATPGRSLLKLIMHNEVLEIIERVLVRVFEKEKDASQVINIYSWNFRSLRHLRILKNMAVSGGLWAPVLDAADEEFTWAVSRTPAATRDYIVPVSKLFSLGVARFHQLHKSEENVSADWLDFLKENEAVKIIQEFDAALMLSLKNLCKDVKEMMQILPYYSSIDEDILRLIDEVDLKKELKEAGEAIVDANKFPHYLREKSAKAVKRFLDYLPKMSIPIERREIGDGWVVTCRGRNGKDLTLSNVNIEKENLLCKVLGGENVLLPVFDECTIETRQISMSSLVHDSKLASDEEGNVEVSILDHVAELIRNAQSHGCWEVGVGDIIQPESPYITGSSLEGLPLSQVLLCAIDLWENLEIDDDELLEIAIRDVSHQIQAQKKRDEAIDMELIADKTWPDESKEIRSRHTKFLKRDQVSIDLNICNTFSSDTSEKRFDPKKDPTVLYLSMSQLTCCLDDFTYRLEPAKRISMFDPVFEGIGTLSIKNASIKLRIECRKERIKKLDGEVTVPVLQLQELHVGLEEVNFRFKETGADWLLNKIVSNFSTGITQLVRDNMKEQISLSINEVLEHLNSYMEVNPEIMLKILGITIDDLEENIAWV